MTEIPCGFITDIKASFELISRHSFFGLDHQIDGQEPFPERQMGVMKNRSRCYGELVSAFVAVVLVAIFNMRNLVRSTPGTFYSLMPFKALNSFAAIFLVAISLNQINDIGFHETPP
jgi:hypothetical protein